MDLDLITAVIEELFDVTHEDAVVKAYEYFTDSTAYLELLDCALA